MTRPQESTLKTNFEKESDDVSLSYLMYDGSESDKLSFPMRIRERYLTPGSCPATLQGIGPELQISIWSERDNIVVRLPFESWHATRPYKGTLSDLGGQAAIISIGRFEDKLRTHTFEDDGSKWIAGKVWTHDYEYPSETT